MAMDARVVGYSETSKGPQRYTVYHVHIKYGGIEWEIPKRYNDFNRLHEELRTKVPEIMNFNFPKKLVLKSNTKYTKEKRRESFDHYLVILSKVKPLRIELIEFVNAVHYLEKRKEEKSSISLSSLTKQLDQVISNTSELLSPSSSSSSSLKLYPLVDNTALTTLFDSLKVDSDKVKRISNFPHLSSMIIITGSITSIFACMLRYSLHHPLGSHNIDDIPPIFNPIIVIIVLSFWCLLLCLVGAHKSDFNG